MVLLAFTAPGSAQIVPPQFVVSGKNAEKIQDFTTINLATAPAIANSCANAAKARGVEISVMVLDTDGNTVYADRMNGQGYLNIVTAEMKARTVLSGRVASKARMDRVLQNPNTEFQEIQRAGRTCFASAGAPLVGLKSPLAISSRLHPQMGRGRSRLNLIAT